MDEVIGTYTGDQGDLIVEFHHVLSICRSQADADRGGVEQKASCEGRWKWQNSMVVLYRRQRDKSSFAHSTTAKVRSHTACSRAGTFILEKHLIRKQRD